MASETEFLADYDLALAPLRRSAVVKSASLPVGNAGSGNERL